MELEIGEFISVIGQSVANAQKALSYGAIQAYFDYFHRQENGVGDGLAPNVAELLIPAPDSETHKKIAVPLVTLTPHNNLELENIKIKLRVSARTDDHGAVMVDLHAPNPDTGADDPGNLTEIELAFQQRPSSEGVSRLVTELNKFL